MTRKHVVDDSEACSGRLGSMSWIDVPKSGLKAWADIGSDFETALSRGALERPAGAGSTEKNYKRQSGSPWRRSMAGSRPRPPCAGGRPAAGNLILDEDRQPGIRPSPIRHWRRRGDAALDLSEMQRARVPAHLDADRSA